MKKEMTDMKEVWLLQGYDDPYLAPFTILVDESVENLFAAAKERYDGELELVDNTHKLYSFYPYSILRTDSRGRKERFEITKATLGEWIE